MVTLSSTAHVQNYYYEKYDKVIEKEMLVRNVYELNIKTQYSWFIKEILKFEILDKEIEGSRFSFNYVSTLTIKCKTVNEPKGLSYIKSRDWLKCENRTINSKKY